MSTVHVCRSSTNMASGSITATTLPLVADVLGTGQGKIRARRIRVVNVVDGARLVRGHGAGADLRGATTDRTQIEK
jgi:hypothetical protein